jgi:hypothetical protein
LTLLASSAPWTVKQFESKGVNALLADKVRPDVRLIFLWRALHFEEMQRRVAQHGLGERVTIINQRVNVSEVLAQVHAVLVLAQGATLVKAYPHSLMKALAAGRPVLVSRAIPMADYVEQTACGVIVENVDAQSILRALDKLTPLFTALRGGLGFAAGNNLALRQALNECQTGYFLLLNNDAIIDEAGMRQLLDTAKQHGASIVGPILRDPLPSEALQSAGGRDAAWHIDTHLHRLPSHLQPYPVEYVPGTAVLIHANLFRQIGLLDGAYFISGEIADFCLRARRHGARPLIDLRVTVYHDQGRSSYCAWRFTLIISCATASCSCANSIRIYGS